jgi:hypothetical protein
MKKLLGCFLCVMLMVFLAAPAAATTSYVLDVDNDPFGADINALWGGVTDTNGDTLGDSDLADETLWLNALRGVYDSSSSDWVDLIDKNDPYDGSYNPTVPTYAVLKYGNGQAPGGESHWAVYFDGSGTFDIFNVEGLPAGITLGDHALSHIAYSAVPEPATLLLLGSGLAGLAGFGRKKFKK